MVLNCTENLSFFQEKIPIFKKFVVKMWSRTYESLQSKPPVQPVVLIYLIFDWQVTGKLNFVD